MIERLVAALPRLIKPSRHDERLLSAIRDGAASLRNASSEVLRKSAERLRKARSQGVSWDGILVSAFTAVCESVRRNCGLELYDTQLRAGLAMARGRIAEMQTGEGKTCAASLPAFLHSLAEGGVHVVTSNAYLAKRDFELLAPVYRAIGATAGQLPEQAPLATKRAAYTCDITYGTSYEYGFDYLREQSGLMRHSRQGLGERYRALLGGDSEPRLLCARRGFAIVDEIDAVLIDEACTPLILSDQPAEPEIGSRIYEQAIGVAATLTHDRDFLCDAEHSDGITLTDQGIRRCYQAIAGEPLVHADGPWSELVRTALVALHALRRDVDYVVSEYKLVFVDSTTGRLCPDRTWRNGLQQLLEAKEGLPLTPERLTAARISRQRYFALYDGVTGMTGTAAESAQEFRQTYRLSIESIAPRLPCRRNTLPDRVFRDDISRLRAVANEIMRVHSNGRPLLIGTRTIERSEQLAAQLDARQIHYQLLNGKQTVAEAEIVARAGRRGAVTIATNMAGRGTDIKLEAGIAEIGGMHLIGVERNDSPRIDRQLAGRVARQGDPGSCQFFISADDSLITRFGGEIGRRLKELPQVDGELQNDMARWITASQTLAGAAARRTREELAAADSCLCDELGELLQ